MRAAEAITAAGTDVNDRSPEIDGGNVPSDKLGSDLVLSCAVSN